MDIDKYISYQIQRQFPSIYVEDGSELVEFIKTYYQFLEQDITGYYVTGYQITGDDISERQYFATKYPTYSQAAAQLSNLQSIAGGYGELKIVSTKNQSVYNNRRLFDFNDIDSTLEQMLLFYKNKYLNGLPFDDNNIRFAVKHILDLYRRKGTKEGLLLFFRLFYSENVDVYYPSQDIIKPSSSKWKAGKYVELYPQDPTNLAGLKDQFIYGSISGATAVVDRVNFFIVNNTIIPVIMLSNVKGVFVSGDDITIDSVSHGVVRGSLQTLFISNTDIRNSTSNNVVGDIVSITSDTGYGGKARISQVTTESAGEIDFVINDGGFGYTLTNTDILVSDQVVFVGNTNVQYIPLERVEQPSTGAVGIVIGQKLISSDTIAVGLLLQTDEFTENGVFYTVDRDVNISNAIQYASPHNNTATAQIGNISNIQTISIITDIIDDFVDVALDSSDYSTVPPASMPMTGTGPITLATTLANAFVPQTFSIGTITSLTGVDPGADYVNDVFVFARENTISRFDLANQVITYDPLTGVVIEAGDILLQNNPAGNTTNMDIKGIVKSRSGNSIEVTQLSFEGFTTSNTMFVSGVSSPITITNIQRNYDSLPMGLNAQISGYVSNEVGKIKSVDVYDSGIGFIDGTTAAMKNYTAIETARRNLESARNNTSATPEQIAQLEAVLDYWMTTDIAVGTTVSYGQGKNEGMWESKTSHLNSKKVIQDSDFYQDFSYQISTSIAPSSYTSPLKDIVHVAGTKVFHKFRLEEYINTELNTSLEIVL